MKSKAAIAENMGDIASGVEAMFNYMRDVVYYPRRADLDLNALPEELKELGEGLKSFGDMISEARIFADSLSRGQLDAEQPALDNEFAAPLKALLSSLKHLTWQAKQVALGDYKQKVNFMGEFSDAFNDMTLQLEQRQDALAKETDAVKKQALYLERSNSLFKSIMGNMPNLVIVIERESSDILFSNHPPKNSLISDAFEEQLYNVLAEYAQEANTGDEPRENDFTLINDMGLQHFTVTLYSINWDNQDAVACVLEDVTEKKEHIDELEHAAYRDLMTGAYNRHYGMKTLYKWTEAKESFAVVFVDMDMLKYVNDVFGHNEGDIYIKAVMELLDAISSKSLVARLGGDEFMVLIKDKDISSASLVDIFEKVRSDLAASASKDAERHDVYPRSISFGIVPVDEDNELPPDDLLSMADERMYEYKKAHKKERKN